MSEATRGFFCAATKAELWTLDLSAAQELETDRLWKIPEGFAAVTGVGIPATLISLLPWLENLRPHWIVNTGIAGGYPGSNLQVGDRVLGISETFADLGVELPDGEGMRPLKAFPFANVFDREPLPLWCPQNFPVGRDKESIHLAHGATVNLAAGKFTTGEMRRRLFGADFESMEGAAVALAALRNQIPVCEVRCISNLAADRDMRPENISLAVKRLSAFWKLNRSKLP